MLPAPDSHRARAAPGRGEAMKGGLSLAAAAGRARWSACVVPAAEVPGGSSRAMSTAAAFVPPQPGPGPAGVTGVIAGPGFQCVTRWGMPEGTISHRHDNGTWLNAAGTTPWPWPRRASRAGRRDDAMHGAGGLVDLKLGHYETRTASRSSTSAARPTSTPRRGCVSCSSIWSARTATSSSSAWTRPGSPAPPAWGCWSAA